MATFAPRTIWFGGDYNPEQWPRSVWDDDIRLMQEAGVTVVTVGVFSWALLEPSDGQFDFGWLDDVLDRLHAGGIGVDLATATASPPPWLTHQHPDVLPVTHDGVRLSAGSRQQYSPSSGTYRRYALRLTRAMAERYGSHPALVAWHVNNEYGCHISRSYDDESAAAFRTWLEDRYGTIDALNAAWGTAFWSQHYTSFEQIEPPRLAPTTTNPTQTLDFDRFSSNALLALFRAEAAILRAVTPDIPITTNFMGAFQPLDYWAWAREVDFVSDDCYPDPADPDSPAVAALQRDLMRSLAGGAPWVLMEQAPSAVNWRPRNAPKHPGGNRAAALQAVARGADGVMHFQWRQSVKGAEKFHSGMIPHPGPESRVFREVVALGRELGELAPVVGSRLSASVAIVFDWDAWWTLSQEAMPARLDYLAQITDWYRAFWSAGVVVDFVPATGDLSSYSLVIVSSLVVASEEALASFASFEGTLVVTFQTAILDPTLGVLPGGYLGALRDGLGVSVEEFAPLAFPDQDGTAPEGSPDILLDGALGPLTATAWSEFIHVRDADIVASFTEGMVAGQPAITRRQGGSAVRWYIGTHLRRGSLQILVDRLLDEAQVETLRAVPASANLEIVRRAGRLFVINHADTAWSGTVGSRLVELDPHGATIFNEEEIR